MIGMKAEDAPDIALAAPVFVDGQKVATLRGAGIKATDSHANFIWLATGDATGSVDAALRASGIWARAFAGDGIRISIGSPEANEAIAAAVISALSQEPANA